MSTRLATYLHLFALTALGGLTVFALTYGVAVPLVRTGLWDSLGWSPRISRELMSVPAWRFLIGYSLIAAYSLSWLSLYQRKAVALALFFLAVMLHLMIWILMTTTPYSNPIAGHIVLIFEAVVATALGLLHLGGHLRGKVLGPIR
jgi:hypothetical protein